MREHQRIYAPLTARVCWKRLDSLFRQVRKEDAFLHHHTVAIRAIARAESMSQSTMQDWGHGYVTAGFALRWASVLAHDGAGCHTAWRIGAMQWSRPLAWLERRVRAHSASPGNRVCQKVLNHRTWR